MQLWDCDIRGADHLAWAGLGTAISPKARSVANVTLWWGDAGVGGSCLWCFAAFLSESAQSKFF